MSEVLIKLSCFVNKQHMWPLLNSNNGAKKFSGWTTGKTILSAPNNDTCTGNPPTSNNKINQANRQAAASL